MSKTPLKSSDNPDQDQFLAILSRDLQVIQSSLLVIAVKVHGDVRGIATWIGINLVLTFVLGGISWQGHLGGLVTGALTGAVVVFAPRQRRGTWQALGLAGVTALVLVATAVRVAVLV